MSSSIVLGTGKWCNSFLLLCLPAKKHRRDAKLSNIFEGGRMAIKECDNNWLLAQYLNFHPTNARRVVCKPCLMGAGRLFGEMKGCQSPWTTTWLYKVRQLGMWDESDNWRERASFAEKAWTRFHSNIGKCSMPQGCWFDVWVVWHLSHVTYHFFFFILL